MRRVHRDCKKSIGGVGPLIYFESRLHQVVENRLYSSHRKIGFNGSLAQRAELAEGFQVFACFDDKSALFAPWR